MEFTNSTPDTCWFNFIKVDVFDFDDELVIISCIVIMMYTLQQNNPSVNRFYSIITLFGSVIAAVKKLAYMAFFFLQEEQLYSILSNSSVTDSL